MNYVKYIECRPAQLQAAIKESPIAYVPIGALEWHGEHGPLGLDGIKAEALCQAAAERSGGVVFPPVFWGAFDTMPFPFTLHYKRRGIKDMIRRTMVQLEEWGFKVIIMLTGHYPPTQVRMLRRESRRFNKKGTAFAMGIPEQALAADMGYFGDHAGMWETSLMLAIRPELIDLETLEPGLNALQRMVRMGIMGKDPRDEADKEKGRLAVDKIASGMAMTARRVVEEGTDDAIEEVYENFARAMKPSWRLAREALDVKGVGELALYGAYGLFLPQIKAMQKRRVRRRRDTEKERR